MVPLGLRLTQVGLQVKGDPEPCKSPLNGATRGPVPGRFLGAPLLELGAQSENR